MTLEEIIKRLSQSVANRAEDYADRLTQEFQDETGEQAPDVVRKSLALGYTEGYQVCLKDTIETFYQAQRQRDNPEDN